MHSTAKKNNSCTYSKYCRNLEADHHSYLCQVSSKLVTLLKFIFVSIYILTFLFLLFLFQDLSFCLSELCKFHVLTLFRLPSLILLGFCNNLNLTCFHLCRSNIVLVYVMMITNDDLRGTGEVVVVGYQKELHCAV